MEGPALKRPKLQLADLSLKDWNLWSHNLEILQRNLPNGCLCSIGILELQRPIFSSSSSNVQSESSPLINSKSSSSTSAASVDNRFLCDYSLQFISTLNMLIDTALKQQFNGFICKKIMDMASELSMDEGTWDMLIGYLDSADKFIISATSKCLVSLLMWTRLPNLNEIIDELFNNVMITTDNPLKLSHILDVIRGVVDYKYVSEPPIFLENDDESIIITTSSNPNVINSTSSSSPSDVIMTDVSSTTTELLSTPTTSTVDIQRPSTVSNNTSSSSSSYLIRASCPKIEVDTEIIENEVKTLCVKALENWWTRLLSKFQNMMAHYDAVNESPIVTFLTLWLGIVSGDNSISVIDTKHYYLHLEAFVPLLNPNSPPIVWSKLTDVFNEILCYGRTLALQDVPNEEPCDLAHLIIRSVRSRQFLQGIPFSRDFSGFGGTSIGPVDWWECKSEKIQIRDKPTLPVRKEEHDPSSSRSHQEGPTPSSLLSKNKEANLSSTSTTITNPLPLLGNSFTNSNNSTTEHNQRLLLIPSTTTTSATTQNKSKPMPKRALSISQTIVIGPSMNAVQLDESFDATFGDRPLLQKVVLLVLKSVAVTVQETRVDGDCESECEEEERDEEEEVVGEGEETSSMDGSSIHSVGSGSGSEGSSSNNDLAFVENSIRDVFRELDLYVKSIQPFHPGAALGEWVIKLFLDQDDALIEAMLCALDTYRGFHAKMEIPADFKESFHPVKTFVSLLVEISNDNSVLLDWLRGAETPHFLTYFLYFLKFVFKNWSEFVSCCGRDLDNTMSVLIRLRMSVGRLTERGLWPYNINPVLRLLEKCEELYENGSNNSSS